MNQRIYDRIREIIETSPNLTQKGLAERMGLGPAQVNRMLHGQRKIMAEEIPMIEDYIGVHLKLSAATAAADIEYPQKAPPTGKPGFSDVPAQFLSFLPETPHAAPFGAPNVFAVYISSREMEPRYFRGELAYVHPGRPPEADRDCLIEMKNGDAYIRRFLRQGENKIRVAQFNPPEEKEIPKKDIKAVHAVVGRG